MKRLKLKLSQDKAWLQQSLRSDVFICTEGYATLFDIYVSDVEEAVDLLFSSRKKAESFKLTYDENPYTNKAVHILMDGKEPCMIVPEIEKLIKKHGKNGVCYVRFEI